MSAHNIFYKKFKSKTSLFYGFCFACVCLVAVNIVFSQKYNKNMYGVMRGESDASINYLKQIWGTPLYSLEIETYRAEGREDILTKWNSIQQENSKKIIKLEDALLSHPYSPELYYNLYLLYSEKGDKIKAADNLKRARQIDPTI